MKTDKEISDKIEDLLRQNCASAVSEEIRNAKVDILEWALTDTKPIIKNMKQILTGNEAVEAYVEIKASWVPSETTRVAGYFTSEDAEDIVGHYDQGSIFAFDNYSGENYFMVFGSVQEAEDWINK